MNMIEMEIKIVFFYVMGSIIKMYLLYNSSDRSGDHQLILLYFLFNYEEAEVPAFMIRSYASMHRI